MIIDGFLAHKKTFSSCARPVFCHACGDYGPIDSVADRTIL